MRIFNGEGGMLMSEERNGPGNCSFSSSMQCVRVLQV